MLSFSDIRSFENPDERFGHCHFCGRDLILLPNDRRGGNCFDCLSLSIVPAGPCPECGASIPGEERSFGCAGCGWYPVRD
jgi:hypothetical protein